MGAVNLAEHVAQDVTNSRVTSQEYEPLLQTSRVFYADRSVVTIRSSIALCTERLPNPHEERG